MGAHGGGYGPSTYGHGIYPNGGYEPDNASKKTRPSDPDLNDEQLEALGCETVNAGLFFDFRKLVRSLEEGDCVDSELQVTVETRTVPGSYTRHDAFGSVPVIYERRVTVRELKDGIPTKTYELVLNEGRAQEQGVTLTSDTLNGIRIKKEELPTVMRLLSRVQEAQKNSPVSTAIKSGRSKTTDVLNK